MKTLISVVMIFLIFGGEIFFWSLITLKLHFLAVWLLFSFYSSLRQFFYQKKDILRSLVAKEQMARKNVSQFKFQNRIQNLKFQKIVGFSFFGFTFLRVDERSSDSYIGRDGFFPYFCPKSVKISSESILISRLGLRFFYAQCISFVDTSERACEHLCISTNLLFFKPNL